MRNFKQFINEKYTLEPNIQPSASGLYRYIKNDQGVVGRAVAFDDQKGFRVINAHGTILPSKFKSWKDIEKYLQNSHLRLEQEDFFGEVLNDS